MNPNQVFSEFDLTPYEEEEIFLIDENVSNYLFGSHDETAG